MSRLRFYTSQTDVLQHALPAADWRRIKPDRPSPFRRAAIAAQLQTYIAQLLISLVERVIGCAVYIENTERELIQFAAPERTLLRSFIERGTVLSWETGDRAVDKPGIAFCRVNIGAIRTVRGETVVEAGGLQAYGIDPDMSTALTIALAEGVERHAASRWDEGALTTASIHELETKRVPYFAHSFGGTPIDRDRKVHWVYAQRLMGHGQVLVPAGMNYLFFSKLHPGEGVFWETSSNGCATHQTVSRALISALNEVLERDGFLMYWLNGLVPRQIDPTSIEDEQVCTWLAELRLANVSVWICDCTTEYGVPIIVTVLRDEVTGGVDVNASAGFDINRALRKAMIDTMRWGLGYVSGSALDEASVRQARAQVRTMEERRLLWHGGHMRSEIEQFVSGPKISFNEFAAQFNTNAFDSVPSIHVRQLLFHLRQSGFDGYWTDLTDDVARDAGLCVVRVIAPELMPMYFDDAQTPFEVERLYTFKRTMGYSDRRTERHELNRVPHPFI